MAKQTPRCGLIAGRDRLHSEQYKKELDEKIAEINRQNNFQTFFNTNPQDWFQHDPTGRRVLDQNGYPVPTERLSRYQELSTEAATKYGINDPELAHSYALDHLPGFTDTAGAAPVIPSTESPAESAPTPTTPENQLPTVAATATPAPTTEQINELQKQRFKDTVLQEQSQYPGNIPDSFDRDNVLQSAAINAAIAGKNQDWGELAKLHSEQLGISLTD